MRLRQIAHMDVVANAGSVRRVVIVAENGHRLAGPRARKTAGSVGFRIVLLADAPGRVRPAGVEIAQTRRCAWWIRSNQPSIVSTITFDSP